MLYYQFDFGTRTRRIAVLKIFQKFPGKISLVKSATFIFYNFAIVEYYSIHASGLIKSNDQVVTFC